MAKGKKYKKALDIIDSEKHYELKEALELCQKASFVKFDEGVDVAIKLGVDPRHADQMIRGAIVLPNGTGKTTKILVFAKGEKAKEAEAAGADIVGDEDLVKKIADGFMDFDSVVATPDMMAQVGKLGRVLGPRGLMPNPKIGTVTNDLKKVITDLKAGMVEYRVEKTGIIHATIGKRSFSLEFLEENFNALLNSLIKAKPVSSKGQYIKGIAISSTMGPGIKIDSGKLL